MIRGPSFCLLGLSLGACLASIDREKIEQGFSSDAGHDGPPVDAIEEPYVNDCTGTAVCDGFERDQLLGPWDTTSIDRGATLALTTMIAHSGTKSLVTTFPKEGGDAGGPFGYLYSAKLAKVAKTNFRAFMYTGSDCKTRSLSTISLSFDYGNAVRRELYLSLSDAGFKFLSIEAKPGTADRYVPITGGGDVVYDRWVEVELQVVSTPAPAQLTLRYDGKTIAEGVVAPFSMPSAQPTARLGGFASGVGPCSLYYDDARLTVTP